MSSPANSPPRPGKEMGPPKRPGPWSLGAERPGAGLLRGTGGDPRIEPAVKLAARSAAGHRVDGEALPIHARVAGHLHRAGRGRDAGRVEPTWNVAGVGVQHVPGSVLDVDVVVVLLHVHQREVELEAGRSVVVGPGAVTVVAVGVRRLD